MQLSYYNFNHEVIANLQNNDIYIRTLPGWLAYNANSLL